MNITKTVYKPLSLNIKLNNDKIDLKSILENHEELIRNYKKILKSQQIFKAKGILVLLKKLMRSL